MARSESASRLLTEDRSRLDRLQTRWPILPPLIVELVHELTRCVHTEATDRAELATCRSQLLDACSVTTSSGAEGLTRFVAQRVVADDTHPFLRRVSHVGPAAVPAPFCEAMALDLAELMAIGNRVDHWLGRLASEPASEPPDGSSETPADPLSLESTPWSVAEPRRHLMRALVAGGDWTRLVHRLGDFVYRYGLGADQGCAAYRFEPGTSAPLAPIHDFAAFDLAWLSGNEERVATLEDNTRNHLDGYRAHNALIWGPRGCGKSSVIRGLITRYWERGLRGIEIPAVSYASLSALYPLVRDRRETFIAVLDNIALDRQDPAARALSTAMDGGLEEAPKNLVFYATSNYKDLIDRDGERLQGPPPLQVDDARAERRTSVPVARDGYDPQAFQRLDERRALDDRFALKVFIDLPTKSQYEQLLIDYARRAGVSEDVDQLLQAFRVWCLRNHHDLVGGRTARDFIRHRFPDVVRRRRPPHAD